MTRILRTLLIGFLIFPAAGFAKTPKILTHLESDVVGTFAGWPVVVIAGGAVTAAALTQADPSVQDSFRGKRHLGSFDTFCRIAGAPYVMDTSSVLLYGAAKLAHNEKLALTGETLLESLFLTEVSTGALKLAFNRRRPNGGNYGFPSGHAARTFAAATTLEVLHGPAIGVPSYLAAGLISATRLDENAHNLSDIIFGAAWGSAISWGTTLFHKKENPKFFVAPLTGGQTGLALAGVF